MLVPMKVSMNPPTHADDVERATGRILLVDGLLAGAMAVAAAVPYLLAHTTMLIGDDGSSVGLTTPSPSRWSVIAVAAVASSPLVVRRLRPRLSFLTVLALNVVASTPAAAAATDGLARFVLGSDLVLLVAAFTLANQVGRRGAVIVGSLTGAVVVVSSAIPYLLEGGPVTQFWRYLLLTPEPYTLTALLLVVLVAQVLREQQLLTERAVRATAVERTAAGLRAATAASAERRRLAAELHDIIAHHVNLMVIQAEKGPFVRDTAASTRTYATIAESGRSALAELDRLLGVLRTDGSGSPGAPQAVPPPTIDEIPSLVDAANHAGATVRLRSFDPPPVVAPAVSDAVHRIVQECITNVVKHADHSEPATLALTHAGTCLVVRMENRSRVAHRRPRRGHGLELMRSRLEVVGGTLSVVERDGRFRVEATVPFTASTGGGIDVPAVTA